MDLLQLGEMPVMVEPHQ